MQKQRFIVTLEILPTFAECFPRIEAERMANIIRDSVEAKGCSFIGSVPFKISVERADEAASALGRIREYSGEEFEQAEEIPGGMIQALDTARAK